MPHTLIYANHIVGVDTVQDKRFLADLRRAWRDKRLVLFLGAGVSASYGLPEWKDLVLQLLLPDGWADPVDRIRLNAMNQWFVEEFEYDPTVVARGIREEIRAEITNAHEQLEAGALELDVERRFLLRLRHTLYAHETRPKAGARTTLSAVADLIARSAPSGNVAAVITPNFDDLLERELKARGIRSVSVWQWDQRSAPGLRVVHSHGFIPRRGALGGQSIVLAEDEYHRLITSSYHWASTELAHYLRTHTVLFIGASLTDPDLRVLLDLTHVGNHVPHWIVKRRHRLSEKDEREFMEKYSPFHRKTKHPKNRSAGWLSDVQQRVEVLGARMIKGTFLSPALQRADGFFESHLERMGVRTQWFDEFSEIPELLERVPDGSRSRRTRSKRASPSPS